MSANVIISYEAGITFIITGIIANLNVTKSPCSVYEQTVIHHNESFINRNK